MLNVAGWGGTSKDGKYSGVLMQLQVPVVNNRVCRNNHIKLGAPKKMVAETINEHVLCAGGHGGKGAWRGDSGSPLMLPIHEHGKFPFYQIGVVSCSFSCAEKNVPAIYTKIQYYSDWIVASLNK